MMPTFYSLYKIISNGESWGESADMLWEVSPVLGIILGGYVTFAVFAVLNVATGVFVDNAHKASEMDEEHSLMEDASERHKHVMEVLEMFHSVDSDGSGTLSLDEFTRHFNNPVVQAYFRLLKMDIEMINPRRVFELLDFDGNGQIDIDEFVKGCTHLKGSAKAIDMAFLISKSNKINKKIDKNQDTLKAMYDVLARMEQSLPTEKYSQNTNLLLSP
eukprot:gnl/MRDRNA2_/MRDRNA2_82643_c0_seq2.p1 gnl/MRDRNA2_/MRDRNA2_82643_c0~~gnl/MRDRNA2_/MRDRNA2_82643_c0_seq2.p1  ORF type:complete len:236 (+),score=45.78 gnl/MRDRNA2_/MRDRNA2_82643_c0_seq2:58-708(+)